GGADALGRAHLRAADQEEFIRDVERRHLPEHLLQAGPRDVARAALGRVILPRALDRHAEDAPLRHPLELPRELPPPIKARDLTIVTAALRPLPQVGPTAILDLLAIVGNDLGRPDPAAVLADDLKRMPLLAPVRVRYLLVDPPHGRRVREDPIDRLVELPLAVEIPHPVRLRAHAELLED